MSLFHFTHRHAKLEHGSIPNKHPEEVNLDIRFGPEDAFGVICKPRTYAKRGSAIRVHWNSNEGVSQFEGELIKTLVGTTETKDFKASLSGNRLLLTQRVNSFKEAVGFAASANQCLPGFLSFRFRTYVWIKEFLIQFGQARFRFGLAEARLSPKPTIKERR